MIAHNGEGLAGSLKSADFPAKSSAPQQRRLQIAHFSGSKKIPLTNQACDCQ
jgi:hypothetical protein